VNTVGGGVFHRWQYLDECEDVQNSPELGRTVLGLSEKAFWQRLARAQSDLVKARTAALERDRPVPAYRELRIVGRSWGWLELQVYPPDEPELYDIHRGRRRGTQRSGAGVLAWFGDGADELQGVLRACQTLRGGGSA